jgi:carboxypeptidase Q
MPFRVAFTGLAFGALLFLAAFARDGGAGAAPGDTQPGEGTSAPPVWLNPHRENADRLIREAQASRLAWDRLAQLTDTFGNRLSGSDNLARAIAWAVETMKQDGFDSVTTEKVMVPRWVRGTESAEIVEPGRHRLAMLGLGGSVATPPAGIEADVVVVRSYDDLHRRAAEVKGKIVLYNAVFTSYGQTNQYRTGGAAAAARHGAVASLVRAIGPTGLRTPHTGNMTYAEDAPRIPAAAVSAEDAERIQRLVDRGQRVRVRLRMEARFLPDVESANVVADIRGRERPDEIVLAGGHFDSWDVGTGASDDGVGCIVTWEAARLMLTLGIRPRRTVRVVLFTNEENGLRGANSYRDAHLAEADRHVLAIESDSGVFAPARIGFTGSIEAQWLMRDVGTLLAPLGLQEIGPGGGGADIGPIAQAGKVPMLAYQGDATRYFTIHHTPADTIDRIAPEEVSRAVAALAVITYVVADLEERLPR